MKLPEIISLLEAGSDRTLLSAEAGNELICLLNALRKMEIEGYKPDWSDANVIFSKADKTKEELGGNGTGQAERFRFVRQYKDYNVAKRWTVNLTETVPGKAGIIGTASETEFRIAKTDETKTSNLDYNARVAGGLVGSVGDYNYAHADPDGSERTATLIDASEFGALTIVTEQEIFPPYIVNESLILAMKVKQGSLMRVVEDGQTYTVDYIELPGRIFRNKPRKVRVCIEGATGQSWFALFYPSGAFQEE